MAYSSALSSLSAFCLIAQLLLKSEIVPLDIRNSDYLKLLSSLWFHQSKYQY